MRHLTSALFLSLSMLTLAQNTTSRQTQLPASQMESLNDSKIALTDSLMRDSLLYAPVVVRDLPEILASLPDTLPELPANPIYGPWVFSGYMTQKEHSFSDALDGMLIDIDDIQKSAWGNEPMTPDWLRYAIANGRISSDYLYNTMLSNPNAIEYTYWDLPIPPRLPDDDVSLGAYINSLNLPDVSVEDALIPEFEQKKIHWIHKFNTGLQFSQAYVSKNWYQGGNNYLQLLYNFYWNVQLNPTYHPNQIFESTVSYKLGINSVDQPDVDRKYSFSEDNFQYNVKYGFKAFKKWFYTLTGLFKTQFFTNYKTNTYTRTASFLSPGDLNLGLGMTYSRVNAKKTFNLSVSIAPISYNLKICIDPKLDPTQFNIKPGHKTHNEIGSSTEVNMTWQATSNISMRTRLFAFTDYNYFQGNVETTWDFAINKFLSTQIYANLRYDSSSDFNISKWHHWMLKEILSFGLSYSFSTK